MKNRVLIVFCLLGVGFSVFAEKKAKNNENERDDELKEVVEYSKKIAFFSDSICFLNDSIKIMNGRIDSMKTSWREICEVAIKQKSSKNVLEKLLKETDMSNEGELYNKLKEALKNAPDDLVDDVERLSEKSSDSDKLIVTDLKKSESVERKSDKNELLLKKDNLNNPQIDLNEK